MIIVLFHVLYLLGKCIYKNYKVKKQEVTDTGMDDNMLDENDDIIDDKLSDNIVDNIDGEADDSMSDDNDNDNDSYKRMPITYHRRGYTEPDSAVKYSNAENRQPHDSCHMRFHPPAYKQRYTAVSEIINDFKYKAKLHKAVDFGCSEIGFFQYLSLTPFLEEILLVDIDRETLERYHVKVSPNCDAYMLGRVFPLRVEICEGSIVHNDQKLENTDLVTCIELIEHLEEDVLNAVPNNIFGFIKPKLVVITTPNADFNVLFTNFSGFRHYDHKFEWTRQQFQEWAKNITMQYPAYEVTFHDICYGPQGTEHLGGVTQMAVFDCVNPDYRSTVVPGVPGLFNTVAWYEYPTCKDNRSEEEKLIDAASYYIRCLAFDSHQVKTEISLRNVLFKLVTFDISLDRLRTVLENNGWAIEDRDYGPVILVPQETLVDLVVGQYPTTKWYKQELHNPLMDEDDWDFDPGPPDGMVRYLEEDDWGNPKYDQESSIVIPQNNSIVKNNTYLFDAENELVGDVSKREDSTSSEKYDETGMKENLNLSLPHSNICFNTDDENDSFDQNISADFNKSMILSDFSSSSKTEEIKKDFVNHAHSSDMQDDSISSTAQLLNRMLNFPVNLSTTRASTSPDPYLPRSVGIDQKFKHDSMCNGSISEYSILNNSLDQKSFCEDNKSRSNNGIENYSNLRGTHLNTLHQESEHTSFEKANTSTVQNSNAMKQGQLCLNTGTSLVSNFVIDNQPQFTSSPKLEAKVNTMCRNRRSINFCEQPSSNHLSNTIKQLQLTELESNNQPVHHVDTSLINEDKIEGNSTSISTRNDNSQQTEGLNTTIPLVSDASVNNAQMLICDKTSQFIHLELIKPETSTRFTDKEDGRNIESQKSINNAESSSHHAKDITHLKMLSLASNEDARNLQSVSVLNTEKRDERVAENTKNVNPAIAEVANSSEVKPFSPETTETPPNSWSPEVMDSGYPNSASAPDMSPEFELSSIAQDHISDSEPPSIAEAPKLAVHEVVEVENGDLANNNRDGEGNNMMAAQLNELNDLQPLIDVLENDLENENDIYALENDFPVWLLRILDMANPIDVEMQIRDHRELIFPDRAGGDNRYMNIEHDEGFNSSSEDSSDLENHEMGEDDNSDVNENAAIDNENVSHNGSMK